MFIATLEKFTDSPLWAHHIVVPQAVAEQLISKNSRRVVCTINHTITIHCALMHDGSGGYFININKDLQKQLKITRGDALTIELVADNSKYGMPMPEEMEELLAQDEEGAQLFHALTPGRQRSLLHVIGKPKNSDIRLNKALVVIDYLKASGGRLDYQELQVAFKNNRFR